MTLSPGRPVPIFIQGIMQRSGTNYLYDLLLLHPDCGRSPLYENHFMTHAEHLQNYVLGLTREWGPDWGWKPDEVFKALGDGLLARLSQGVKEPRLVTKTPAVRHLSLFHKLFPAAPMLLLVRDGRAIVESGVHTFKNWTYERAMRRWAAAAKTILEFRASQGEASSCHLLVRYEDLFSGSRPELERILAYLGLDLAQYDFDQAQQLPVRGSSAFRGGSESVRWDVRVPRSGGFDPLQRWQHWPRRRHERFNWLAGAYMQQLGYPLKQFQNQRHLWQAWNILQDRRWAWQARFRRNLSRGSRANDLTKPG
jgi:hypothetical protein